MIQTLLFDLDGTLLDTAPDLGYALNCVLQENGASALAAAQIRPQVSHGTLGLIRLGFGIGPEHPRFEPLRQRLLAIYEGRLAHDTRLFPGMRELLDALPGEGMRWGVVTNKPGWLTTPLLQQMGLYDDCACVVSGDTTSKRKPDPEPMLHACELAACRAETCIYIGDAERDIIAGKRAGMRTLVAGYGYIGADEQPSAWGADAIVEQPSDILPWVRRQSA